MCCGDVDISTQPRRMKGGYDVIPFMLKPLEEVERDPMVNSDNYALLKDISTASPVMETEFDYTYATVDKKKGESGNYVSTSLSATEDHLPHHSSEESPVDKTKETEKENKATSSSETAVAELHAQVDKKKNKKAKEPTCMLTRDTSGPVVRSSGQEEAEE